MYLSESVTFGESPAISFRPLTYYNVQPIGALSGLSELHIGHSIVARAVFVGLRRAVSEMKALLREAAARDPGELS